jgi:probable rRNA maturation factor
MPLTNAKIQFHILQPVSLTERTRLKQFIIKLFRQEKKPLAELSYIFCSDQYLLDINRQFLQHDFYTDIITFPLSDPGQPISGEIYISVDRVRDNAREFGSSIRQELLRVIFHGALHLCGYKDKSPRDEKLMRAMEDKYLTLYDRST